MHTLNNKLIANMFLFTRALNGHSEQQYMNSAVSQAVLVFATLTHQIFATQHTKKTRDHIFYEQQ